MLVPVELMAVAGAGAGVETCTSWCLWDQPRFAGTMVELTDGACKDFAVKSAANNSTDDKTAMFFYRQPGCQGKPFNPFGMKSKMQSPHVDAVSAVVKPATR
jgi:Peptidase inhibitor family I36